MSQVGRPTEAKSQVNEPQIGITMTTKHPKLGPLCSNITDEVPEVSPAAGFLDIQEGLPVTLSPLVKRVTAMARNLTSQLVAAMNEAARTGHKDASTTLSSQWELSRQG